jgi:hypothetical protein
MTAIFYYLLKKYAYDPAYYRARNWYALSYALPLQHLELRKPIDRNMEKDTEGK